MISVRGEDKEPAEMFERTLAALFLTPRNKSFIF